MKIKVQSQPYNKVVKLSAGQQARVDAAPVGTFLVKADNADAVKVQQGQAGTAVVYSGLPTFVVDSGGAGSNGATGATGAAGSTGATGATGASGTTEFVSKQNVELDGMYKGTVVYLFDNTRIKRALANNDDRKRVLGLVADSTIPSFGSGNIMTSGVFTMLLSEWAPVVEDSEGFVGDQYYYLSPLLDGKITRVAPLASGQFVCPIGYSVSATSLLIRIGQTVAL
jgi:hypothetical protein